MKNSAHLLLAAVLFFSFFFLFLKSTGGQQDTTGPVFSNISVSVKETSATITWTTDEAATSTIEWGTTSDNDTWDQSSTDPSQVTSHSITIGSLSAGTVYYYILYGTDVAGNGTATAANTFTTSSSSSTTTGDSTATKVEKTLKLLREKQLLKLQIPAPTPKIVSDITKPQVTITTDLTSSFKEAPKIEGKATDSGDVNPGISKIEYSIDDGKNWLEVDNIKSPNAKSTTFDFIPVIFEDGNYKLRVRVKDNSGNLVTTEVKTLVIDRLPPSVGGILFSIGPLIINPDINGNIVTLKGLEHKITLSAVGGATEINIVSNLSDLSHLQTYNLVKNINNGLWSGTLSFPKAGIYKLKVKSVDGAGNTTEKTVNSAVVTEGGRVIDESGVAIKDAKVTLYYYDIASQQFSVWDGSSFGQKNPQKVSSDGNFNLLAPSGKYYIQISAPNYKSLKSEIFSLEKTTSINANFILKRAKGFFIGPIFLSIPEFTPESAKVKINLPATEEKNSEKILNKEIPPFSFKDGEEEVSSNDFKGKPTVLSFMSSWYPQTSEQLIILNDLPKKQFNSGVIMEQETASHVSIFKKKGGYSLPILSDRDGILIEPLGILSLPTHIFLDRKGMVRDIKVGILTSDEIIENLVN